MDSAARVRERGPATLHLEPPLTAGNVHAQARWILPAAAALFVVLAVLARIDALPWDRPITNWIVDQRTPRLNHLAKAVTHFGAESVVYVVAVLCAVVAWPRCRPLAISIAVLAVSRPLIVAALKEIVARDRPPAVVQVVHPDGYSFPSGHPFATAASWCFIPLVIALYTRRRSIWWVSVFAVWTLVGLVAASRVYLGAHYASDVLGSLLLAPLFVFGSELLIEFIHRRSAHGRSCAALQDGTAERANTPPSSGSFLRAGGRTLLHVRNRTLERDDQVPDQGPPRVQWRRACSTLGSVITTPVAPEFDVLPDDRTLDDTVAALEGQDFSIEVVDILLAARDPVITRMTGGSSVMTNTSVTLDATGIVAAVNADGSACQSVRNKLIGLDFSTQLRKMKGLAYGHASRVEKVLEIHEDRPGRIHVVLIRQAIGF